MQVAAQLIADALHHLEGHILKGKDERAKNLVARLHIRMSDGLTAHGPALGLDPVPLSGGTPKPPAV